MQLKKEKLLSKRVVRQILLALRVTVDIVKKENASEDFLEYCIKSSSRRLQYLLNIDPDIINQNTLHMVLRADLDEIYAGSTEEVQEAFGEWIYPADSIPRTPDPEKEWVEVLDYLLTLVGRLSGYTFKILNSNRLGDEWYEVMGLLFAFLDTKSQGQISRGLPPKISEEFFNKIRR